MKRVNTRSDLHFIHQYGTNTVLTDQSFVPKDDANLIFFGLIIKKYFHNTDNFLPQTH
jgi:hypothetical protein